MPIEQTQKIIVLEQCKGVAYTASQVSSVNMCSSPSERMHPIICNLVGVCFVSGTCVCMFRKIAIHQCENPLAVLSQVCTNWGYLGASSAVLSSRVEVVMVPEASVFMA